MTIEISIETQTNNLEQGLVEAQDAWGLKSALALAIQAELDKLQSETQKIKE